MRDAYILTHKQAHTQTIKVLTVICIIKLMFHVFVCMPTKN